MDLSTAIFVATIAHDGQLDKGNKPYILHPIRVMLAGETEDERIVGILHDVVEDTAVTQAHLEAMDFSDVVLEAVWAVTRDDNETYDQFISRIIATSRLAIKVKINDIKDNLNPNRMSVLNEKEAASMARRYIRSLQRLERALNAIDARGY